MTRNTFVLRRKTGGVVLWAVAVGLLAAVALLPSQLVAQTASTPAVAAASSESLSARQEAIVVIGAFAAAGDITRLGTALNGGLDAGLSVNEAKEVLVQVYAYAGFPRSLNALGELMKVLDARRQRGIQDPPGREPSRTIPTGEALLAAGTANQTRLAGAPVRGPLFEFAPAGPGDRRGRPAIEPALVHPPRPHQGPARRPGRHFPTRPRPTTHPDRSPTSGPAGDVGDPRREARTAVAG